MRQIVSIEEMRQACASVGDSGRRLGFVPTMGYLHEGHLSLVRRALAECDSTAVSIFVNPLQFGPSEDFGRYPADLTRDRSLLEEAGVDYLFTPEAETLTPPSQLTSVDVAGVTEGLCGARRAGHFRGVATIVAKLFNIVRPEKAYFGQKDWQQSVVVRRMAADLNFDLEIVVCPTVREPDGLALSSRNAYLSPSERKSAPALYRALLDSQQRILSSGIRLPPFAEAAGKALRGAGLEPEYLELRDARTLEPVSELREGMELLLAAAARLGSARLIDNVVFRIPEGGKEAP